MSIKIAILNPKNGSESVECPANIFDVPFKERLVHQAVLAYLAKGRQGTRAQKTRSEVSGSGKKPWRQKGTGRARAGSVTSPLWRSGGVTFAAKPQNFEQKMNRKMYRGAIKSIVSELARSQRLTCVEAFEIAAPKTKLLVDRLKALDAVSALIITAQADDHLYFAARNLPGVKYLPANHLNPVDLIKYPKSVVTIEAIKVIEEMLS